MENKKVTNLDAWVNTLTGQGDENQDKTKSNIAGIPFLTEYGAENIYGGDDLGRKIVEIIPLLGTQKFIEIKGDFKQKDNLINHMNKINLKHKCYEAWRDARIYGGAMTLMVFDDNIKKWNEPVNYKTIKEIKSLIVFNRWELHNKEMNLTTDIKSHNYGLPDSYEIQSSDNLDSDILHVSIHHSRFLRFDGHYLPKNAFRANLYWHNSVLANLVFELGNYFQVNNGLANLLSDWRVNVLSIHDLSNKLANEEGQDQLKARVKALNLTKSILKAMVIDAEHEKFEQNSPGNISGIEKLYQKIEDRIVALTRIPHTVLLGASPKGLGATGRHEETNFYDYILSQQNEILRPVLNQFFKIFFKDEIPDEFSYDFVSLKQMTDLEKADIREKMAKADALYLADRVLTTDEVANSRFGGDDYSLETNLDRELREREEEISPLEEEQGEE